MTKEELTRLVSIETGVSQKKVKEVLNCVLDNIMEETRKGGKIALTGFGSFKKVRRKAKVGRNPITGERIQISERDTPRFQYGKKFRDVLNAETP